MIKFYSAGEGRNIKRMVLNDKGGIVIEATNFSLYDTINYIYEKINIPFRDDNLDGFNDALINLSYYSKTPIILFHEKFECGSNMGLRQYVEVLKSVNIYNKVWDKDDYANLVMWFNAEDKSFIDLIKGGYSYYEKGDWHILYSLPIIITPLHLNIIMECFNSIDRLVIDGIQYDEANLLTDFNELSIKGKMLGISKKVTIDFDNGTNTIVMKFTRWGGKDILEASKIYDLLCKHLGVSYE